MVWLLAGLWLLLMLVQHRWQYGATIKEDVVSYYSYLPATFLYSDLSMEYAHHDAFFDGKLWGLEAENGGFIQKYTYGLSLLYLPFFLLALGIAWISGAPLDGYSWPFEACLQLSAIFYAAVGLWILRKWLLQWFEDRTVMLTLLAMVGGTHLFYYVVGHGPMPHAYLFFLLTAFVALVQRFVEHPGGATAAGIGLAGGMAVLIRPVHAVIWLVPVLYAWVRLGGMAPLVRFMQRNALFFLPILLLPILLWLPQLAYWKFMTGNWWFWSYNDEGFFWTDPKVGQVLLGFRKGWLVYTPLMALALMGWGMAWKRLREWRWALFVPFLLSVYAMAAWWCWWFGGSLGMRPMIDFYGWLAPGLAALIAWAWKSKPRKALGVVIVLLMCLNAFQTLQYVKGIIHYDAMTWPAYKASFGKLTPPEGYDQLLVAPDYEKAKARN